MLGVLLMCFLFIPPVAAGVFFTISLCRYISAKKQFKKDPGSIKSGELENRQILLIVSSVILAVFLLIVLGVFALTYLSIAYM